MDGVLYAQEPVRMCQDTKAFIILSYISGIWSFDMFEHFEHHGIVIGLMEREDW